MSGNVPKSGGEIKMKSFSLANSSTTRKPGSKLEIEKQKKLEADAEAAKAYEEFVATFDSDSTATTIKPKTFIKGSVINPGSGEEETDSRSVYQANKLKHLEEKHNKTKLQTTKSIFGNDDVKSDSQKPPLPKKSKEKEKKKSNLELFKEELKQMQQEREEKNRKGVGVGSITIPSLSSTTTCLKSADEKRLELIEAIIKPAEKSIPTGGSFDTGDPCTTNIYLGNINPKMTEQQLMEHFGKYGPLASVKVMWPRTDEERARNRNCGFVAFMNRTDGERAIKHLNGRDIMGYEMKLGWGKAVPIPPHPVYLPPKLLELTMPPPPSGLPFNAQSDNKADPIRPESIKRASDTEKRKLLSKTTVKVVAPTDRGVLQLIHRMAEFVVNEGPMFEAVIMNREINNPIFRFLFDNSSPAHVYYRWRLFSLLQGDSTNNWLTDEFTMFDGGSKWKPPPVNPFGKGIPDELLDLSPLRAEEEDGDEDEDKAVMTSPDHRSRKRHHSSSRSSSSRKDHRDRDGDRNRNSKSSKSSNVSKSGSSAMKSSDRNPVKKGCLRSTEREKLEELLRNLTPEKSIIGNAMVYCIENADGAIEITECITESLGIPETPLHKKIARFYLISDILHNCVVKVTNSSYYRSGFQSNLESIAHSLHDSFISIEGRLKAEHFKQRVMNVFRAWEDWALFSYDFLDKLQNIFLGLTISTATIPKVDTSIDGVPLEMTTVPTLADVDGVPLPSDDIDGNPIIGSESSQVSKVSCEDHHDVVTSYLLPSSSSSSGSAIAKFKPSKWETVDPEVVEAQAMTTSKWEELETESVMMKEDDEEEDLDGNPIESYDSPTTISSTASDGQHDTRGLHFLNQLHSELNEERRILLREVELQVLKFQDELESGKRIPKVGISIEKQIEEYRKDLIRKEYSKVSTKSGGSNNGSKRRSPSRTSSHRKSSRSHSRTPPSRKDSNKSHSRSPKRNKSRTKSPSSSSSSTSRHRHHSPSSGKGGGGAIQSTHHHSGHHQHHHRSDVGHSSSSVSISSSSHRRRSSPSPEIPSGHRRSSSHSKR